jgi:hypothetical protein
VYRIVEEIVILQKDDSSTEEESPHHQRRNDAFFVGKGTFFSFNQGKGSGTCTQKASYFSNKSNIVRAVFLGINQL